MSERTFRFIIGALLLAALYFGMDHLMRAIIAVLVLEAISNWRIPLLITRLRKQDTSSFHDSAHILLTGDRDHRFSFDAERAWRLVVAAMLVLTLYFFNDLLWFFPWFMGFAILGAGISGVCPVLISLKFAGFR